MDTFFIPLLLLLLLPLIFFFAKKGSVKKLPPGSEGWPIFGETVDIFLIGLQQLVRDRMQKYSPVMFKTSLFGEKMAVLCGAEGNKFVFTNENKHLFSTWRPTPLMKLLFPDLNRHKQTEPVNTFRNFQYDALKPGALKQYLPVMDNLAREHMRHSWSPNSEEAKAHPLAKKYAMELSLKVFMDVGDPEVVDKLLEPFSHLTSGLVSLPVNLPGTALNRAIRGRKVLHDELMRVIRERREEMLKTGSEGREDMLSNMVVATNKDGEYMSDNQIANVIVGVLVGAQYEVSSALTIVINFLAQLPHIYDQVLKEQMEIAKSRCPDELLIMTMEDVNKMKYTWNVICESWRLVPPGVGGFREAITDISYAGFTIPKGWKVNWTGHSTNMNPNYFPEPEKFDPSRFEGSGPAPYTYMVFGEGPSICPGRKYVKLVLLIFVHNLVTSFRLEKILPNEKILYHGLSPSPAHGLPLRLHPHQI